MLSTDAVYIIAIMFLFAKFFMDSAGIPRPLWFAVGHVLINVMLVSVLVVGILNDIAAHLERKAAKLKEQIDEEEKKRNGQ